MKNKILLGITALVLMVGSFFGGSYFEKQKPKSSPASVVSPIQNPTVVEVTDGDTLKLSDGKTFRLYGVNSPEVKEPYFEEAKTFTQNLVLGKEISFEQEKNYKVDKFGRELGYVFIDGVNLNIELVRNGLARVVLYEKRAKIKYQDELLSVEKEAKEKRLGVWKNESVKEMLTYNFGGINFPYEKSWQMIESQRDESTINFFIKSLCINKESKTIIPNSEMNCDVTIADYLPLKEQKSILNLNQFINFISSQGQDSTMPTPFINNFVNDKNISVTKWVGPHALSGELIEGYFFQYTDQTNQLHFVHLFGDPVRISANDVALKSFVNQIIKSVGVN